MLMVVVLALEFSRYETVNEATPNCAAKSMDESGGFDDRLDDIDSPYTDPVVFDDWVP